MREVLISIQPKWCELIASGKKTVEVRKTRPKIDTPFKCYIYCTNNKRQYLRKLETHCQKIFFTEKRDVLGRTEKVNSLVGDDTTFWENGGYNGRVIGEFVCDAVEYYTSNCTVFESVLLPSPSELKEMCLTLDEFNSYGTRGKLLYGWHISDLVIYDKPKELSEFVTHCKYEFDDDFEHCEGCQFYCYSNTPSCGIEEYCGCDGLKPITRPPQSWCYVELLKGGAE